MALLSPDSSESRHPSPPEPTHSRSSPPERPHSRSPPPKETLSQPSPPESSAPPAVTVPSPAAQTNVKVSIWVQPGQSGGFTAAQFAQHEQRLLSARPVSGESSVGLPFRPVPPPVLPVRLGRQASWTSRAPTKGGHGDGAALVGPSGSFGSLGSVAGSSDDGIHSFPRGGYSLRLLNHYLSSATTTVGSESKLPIRPVASFDQDEPPKSTQVPDKKYPKVVRNLRHIVFSVYRRLYSIVLIVNLAGLAVFFGLHGGKGSRMPVSPLASAGAANLMVAVLIRQDYIVNALFRTCWLVPLSAPLRLRRMLAKVYEHGGVHSGAAVSGTVWMAILTSVLTFRFARGSVHAPAALVLAYVLLVLLIAITVCAYPRLRFASHNAFELTHRFAGWLAVGLFWIELGLIADEIGSKSQISTSKALISEPAFWFLIVITVHLILPWIRLRKWTFTPEVLSSHALRLHFSSTLAPFSGIAISKSPLVEWHPFATFPSPDGSPGGSLIISDAGDWTKQTIANPATQYWVKGIPRTGVLSMAVIFQRVVIVTTGSGIGPCLSFLVDSHRRQPARLLWSTPSPVETFGTTICETVRKVDPEAIIHDTRLNGRPDMVAMAYRLFVQSGAEAVFVISNPWLTRKIVYAMESRGVPAFGPIWDS